jgi:AMP nucleosidase
MTQTQDLPAIIDRLQALYAGSVRDLRAALKSYLETGARPSAEARARGLFAYPQIQVTYEPEPDAPLSHSRGARAFGRLTDPGVYTLTITRPGFFRDYLIEQLGYLVRDYNVRITVGPSEQEIPYPYVLDATQDLGLDALASREVARWFPTTDLQGIGDETADGMWNAALDATRPLGLFDAPRIDFSLARLTHYTGAPAEHVQQYILFTNYHRYVDAFVAWACEQLKTPGSGYVSLSCAGGVMVGPETADPERAVADGAWRRHQMPAYHLMRADGAGVSLVNIGVGPSNAKTITDHLAVLRPQAWLMIGHCGGLRANQTIGDYVLAHAYLRDDHVLDDVLPPEIPVPALAEIQQALYRAAEIVTGEDGETLKKRLRTGTVVTTDDRNWELRYASSALRFSQSRAVGIDMESATIAAQGYRFRVPYGTLLCVSDKPLHGEIKLPGQANKFYDRAIGEHIKIGIATVDLLREEGDRLHSRKLRAFDEPPFR